MADQFRRYRPGDRQLSAGDLNRQAEAEECSVSTFGVQGAGRLRMTGIDSPTPGPGDSWWAKITGAASTATDVAAGAAECVGAYPTQQVVRNPAVGSCGYVPLGDGIVGTLLKLPAYEVTGNAQLPVNTIVRVYVSADQRSLEFCTGGVCVPVITDPNTCVIKYIWVLAVSDTPCPS